MRVVRMRNELTFPPLVRVHEDNQPVSLNTVKMLITIRARELKLLQVI